MALILVVDDEAGIREMLRAVLEEDGHRVQVAEHAESALARVLDEGADLLITDISMPGMSGVELLEAIKRQGREIPAIVITAFGSKESAIEAMRQGAVNYLEKPFDVEEMRMHVRRALGQQRLTDENRRLRATLQVEADIIGRSSAIRDVKSLVERIAPTDSTVLITGESGTGKEVVARAIHAASNRGDQPFVSVNCGAIPDHLLESELFGAIRGAYTGADKDRRGLVQAADGGTLFLDEIGDMPHEMQVKLLRVLQERCIRRVGGTEEVPVDVRILTATHQDLETLVRDKVFREDLYYRINVIRVAVPALRERRDDIPEFVYRFAEKHAESMGRRVTGFEPGFIDALCSHSWPGNVRELENVVERAVALSTGERLEKSSLDPMLFCGDRRERSGSQQATLDDIGDIEEHLESERKRFMEEALLACGSVQTKAAERLGMTTRSFRYFARKYGLLRSAGQAEEEVHATSHED